MKLFFIISSFIVLANAVTYVPSAIRVRRDVAELVAEPQNTYLAPANADVVDIPAEPITEIEPQNVYLAPPNADVVELPNEQPESQDSAVLGETGYEYKTVRKLRLRNIRDVSHLNLHYLPPKNEYLPPVVAQEAQISTEQPQTVNEYVEPASVKELDVVPTEQPQPIHEYLPPVNVKGSETPAEQAEPSNEYLPPANVKDSEITEEISEPSNEYLPPAKLEEFPETHESELEPSAKTIEDIEPATEAEAEITTDAVLREADIESDIPEDSAILLSDGYHYKKPADIPDIMPQTTGPSGLFLPPLEEAIVEGPLNGESAVLADDGYHYRAIKRRF